MADTNIVEILVCSILAYMPVFDSVSVLLDPDEHSQGDYKHSYEVGVDNFRVIVSHVEDGKGVQVVYGLHTFRFNDRIASPIHRHEEHQAKDTYEGENVGYLTLEHQEKEIVKSIHVKQSFIICAVNHLSPVN